MPRAQELPIDRPCYSHFFGLYTEYCQACDRANRTRDGVEYDASVMEGKRIGRQRRGKAVELQSLIHPFLPPAKAPVGEGLLSIR